MLKKILLSIAFLLALTSLAFGYLMATSKPKIPELEGQYSRHWLSHDGIDRSFSVYRPKSLRAGAPLLFVLHGSNGSGEAIRQKTGAEFDTLADQYGMLVVYPDGYERHWNDCRASADYLANTQNIDDVGFIGAIIDQLDDGASIDRRKVFATGMSNGGQMVYRLALEAPQLFAGFSAIAANLPVDDNLDCSKSGQAVSIAVFNGTADRLNPYEGGLVSIMGNDSRGVVVSTEQTIGYWRSLANLVGEGETFVHPETDGNDDSGVVETRWLQAGGEQVRLYTLEGSGHVIPSKLRVSPLLALVGGAAADISGPEEIVGFFLSLAE